MGSHVSGRVRLRLDHGRVMPRRSPRARLAIACAAGCTFVSGCWAQRPDAGEAGSDPIVVIDATGSRVALAEPARRVVSLVPSATATLHALGADGVLVGRTEYDTQDWARHLPSVGGGLEPSLEAIVALEPDLVVRFAGEQDPRTRSRLDELGIRYLTVRPDGLDDIFETAHLLGQVTGRGEAGDSLAQAIRHGLEGTKDAVAGWPRLRFAYVLGGSPPWVSGPGTYIDEVLALVGGDNAFSDLDALWTPVSPEELRTRRIDVVLVSIRGEYDEGLTPDARIVEIGSALEIPGPDVVSAARAVAELMHGRPLR